MLKNKIHAALIRNGIQSPWSDLFGKNGRQFLEKVLLPANEQIIVCSRYGCWHWKQICTLRWILVQCAQRAIQSPGELRSIYLALKEIKGHKVGTNGNKRRMSRWYRIEIKRME